jgi:hypothetical protein
VGYSSDVKGYSSDIKPFPEGGIPLNIPQGEMDKGFKFLFYSLINQAGTIISNSRGPTDPRLYMITLLLIGLVPKDKDWIDIRQKLEDWIVAEVEIEETRSGGKIEDNETLAMCRFAACMDALHEVTAFLDHYEGLTHTLVIGEI